MTALKTPEDIKQLGTILSVWAHPDDETFIAAGIMMQAIANGQTVACITATQGENGVQDSDKWSSDTLGGVRTQELQSALEILGVANHHWLDYKDGECAKIPDDEAAAHIKKYIEQYQPDTILTFGQEGMTGHPDHRSVSRWVSRAVELSSEKPVIYHAAVTTAQYDKYLRDLDQTINLFFSIDKPPLCDVAECALCFELSPALSRRKCDALAVMSSQTEKMFTHYSRDTLESWLNEETFTRVT